MVIVDSSVWIDAVNSVPTEHAIWLHRRLGREPIGLTSLIFCEVLQGMRSERRFREVRDELQHLPVFENYSTGLAIKAAENYRFLRVKGITIRKTIDCMIATYCIAHGFPLHLGLELLDPSIGAID